MARADVTPEQWASALLQRLGVPSSKGALQAVVGWERAEGGHYHNSARFNPLNTTMPAKGAGNTGTQGNIKVYRSWQQGLDATVKTLRNGLYGGILQALKAGNPQAVGQAIEKSPWGTGGLAAKVIGQTRIKGGAAQPAGALLSAAGGSQPVTTTRSSDNMGGSADALSLLQALQASTRQPRQTAGIQAPSFSAQPAMPAGAMIPHGGGMGSSSQPDLTQLLASITTPGADVAKTTVSGGGSSGTIDPTSGAGAPAAAGDGHMPKGVGTFEGHKVAAWIVPYLSKARQLGWKGTIGSGYRSFADQTRIYNSGVRPAAKPGTSNHEGANYPRGAVDVDRQSAPQLAEILRKLGAPLQWAGAKDPVHFSHPHNGSY